ncbi:MAG: hypothetical protein WAS55_03935 [Saprospiraceae bacterium]|nr:hypothetical protein [Saprospiraceae bacterium]
MQSNFIIQTHKLQGHKAAVYCLCNGFERHTFFSAGSDGIICKWNSELTSDGILFASTGERIFSLAAFSEFGVLFAGTMLGDLFYIDFEKGSTAKRFRFHQHSIYRLAKWNEILVAIAGDGIISLWNARDGKLMDHLKISNAKLRSLAIDSKNNTAFIGDSNGTIHILSLPDLQIIHQIHEYHQKTIFSMCYLESEKYLITGGLDAMIRVLNADNQSVIEIKSHWFCVNDICNLEGSPFFATASRDKSIRIWNKANWSLVKEISSPKFAAHMHSVNSLYWMQFMETLFSCGDDGIIYGWKLNIENDTK